MPTEALDFDPVEALVPNGQLLVSDTWVLEKNLRAFQTQLERRKALRAPRTSPKLAREDVTGRGLEDRLPALRTRSAPQWPCTPSQPDWPDVPDRLPNGPATRSALQRRRRRRAEMHIVGPFVRWVFFPKDHPFLVSL